MYKSLVVPFSLDSDEYWVKIEQVLPESIEAGLGEIADVLDSLYGHNPCGIYNEIEKASTIISDPPDVQTEEEAAELVENQQSFFNSTIRDRIDFAMCDKDINNNYVTEVIITVSHPEIPYRLQLTNGIIGVTIKSGEYDTVSVTVLSEDGEVGDCRAIVFYRGITEEIDLEKPESEDETENDRSAYCSNSINVVIGDDDDEITCWERHIIEHRCKCSYALAYKTEEEVIVPCPTSLTKCTRGAFSDAYEDEDGVTHCSSYMGLRTVSGDFVDCPEYFYSTATGKVEFGGLDSNLSKSTYYVERCCVSPIKALPECSVTYEKNKGGSELDPETLALYELTYGDQLELIPIAPEDGDCGYIKTIIEDRPRQCCEYVDPILPLPGNPTSIGASAYTKIEVTEGLGPYTWQTGEGYFFADSVTDDPFNYLQSEADVCGSATVKVSDSCSTTFIVLTFSGLTNIPELPQRVIFAPDSSHLLVFKYSIHPINWTLDGAIEIEAYQGDTAIFVRTDEDFCGTARVVAVDACGNIATTLIQSTDGYWNQIYQEDRCSFGNDSIVEEVFTNYPMCGLTNGPWAEVYMASGNKHIVDLYGSYCLGGGCCSDDRLSVRSSCDSGLQLTNATIMDIARNYTDGHCDTYYPYCTVHLDNPYDLVYPGDTYTFYWGQHISKSYEWICA